MHLTFLYGTSPTYVPAKSFRLEPSGIVKVSGFDLGYYFRSVSFSHSENLSIVAETFRNFARDGWFRIYGVPAIGITGTADRKLAENFPELPNKFVHLDIDKFTVPNELPAKANWSLSDPNSTATLIREVLSYLGWGSVAFSDFVFVLSSSQFTRDIINCHVYFVLEKEKSLDEMRAIVIAYNRLKGAKVLDPAPYNPVQPDYIAPPKCINFADPIPEHARIAYSQGLSAIVPEQLFQQDVFNNTPKGWSTSGLVDKIGANWLESIRLYVGTERGINEPAFRAAAQLVNEVGKNQVIQNIDRYAQEMFDASWKAIISHGKRGNAADRQTYTVSTFRQYLESATRQGKKFGEEVDELTAEIMTAADLACIGDLTVLTGRPAITSAKKLRERYPGVWTQVKMKLRKKLKGIITIAEINELMKRTAGEPSTGTSLTPAEIGGTTIHEGQSENDLIRPILSTYDFILDQDGNSYMVPLNGKGNILPLNGEVTNIFYRDGLLRSNNTVSIQFGKKCVSVLLADRYNPMSVAVKFKKELVGKRVIPLGDGIAKGCWYNAGHQLDGIHRSIHLSSSGPVIHENVETPKWINVASNILPTDDMFHSRFGKELKPTPEFLIDFFKENITKFIRCDGYDLTALTSWLVTALTNRPLAYIGEFIGPHNCGKSTGADLAKDLVDPSIQALGSGASRSVFSGKTDENFFSLIHDQLITIIDNVGVLSPQTQDVLCQVSTGMKYNIRIMYTQTQLDRFIQRPIILTGLSKIITRPDLISRTMTINFMDIPKFNSDFINEWYADKPFLFGGLLHIASLVMKYIDGASAKDFGKISQRDIVFAAVSSVLSGVTMIDTKAVINRNMAQYIDQVTGSDFCLALFCFFQEQKNNIVILTTSELRTMFAEWAELNRGVTKRAKICSDAEYYGEHEFRISFKAVPESNNAMGWMLNKFHHAFEALSGWHLDMHGRNSKGIRRKYTRKLNLTNIL